MKKTKAIDLKMHAADIYKKLNDGDKQQLKFLNEIEKECVDIYIIHRIQNEIGRIWSNAIMRQVRSLQRDMKKALKSN